MKLFELTVRIGGTILLVIGTVTVFGWIWGWPPSARWHCPDECKTEYGSWVCTVNEHGDVLHCG